MTNCHFMLEPCIVYVTMAPEVDPSTCLVVSGIVKSESFTVKAEDLYFF